MSTVLVPVDISKPENQKKVLAMITALFAMSGGKAAPAKTAGKNKKQEEEEIDLDGEFVDEDEIGGHLTEEEIEETDFGSEGEEEDFGDFGEEEEEAPKTTKKAAPAKGKAPTVKLDDVIKGFQSLTKKKKNGEAIAKKILDKYGVKNVKKLKESDLPAVLKLIKAQIEK